MTEQSKVITPLTDEIISRLMYAKDQHSFFQWEIGECALIAWQHIQDSKMLVSKEVMVAHISEIVERGQRRIYKIIKVVEVFGGVKERFPILSFGYFERALDFEIGRDGGTHQEGLDFLEFANEQRLSPTGKRTIEACIWLFRSQILGEAVEDEYTVEYDPDEPAAPLDFGNEEPYVPTTEVGDDKERLYIILEGLIAPLRSLGVEGHVGGAKVMAGINLILEGLRDMEKKEQGELTIEQPV